MISIAKSKVFGFLHGLAFITISLSISWLALTNSASSAQSSSLPKLMLPVICEVGQSCLVQKLVDHDSGSERRDYRCGKLTTDGHDGVDIRLRTLDDMRAGYRVVAAASGTVLRTRDGEPDISTRMRDGIARKEAGNGIVIDHGNGWHTQYSHMLQGSVTVQPGRKVTAGTPLGLIGMSGNSEFPHLHFSIRHNGIIIDPFTGERQGTACDSTAKGKGLWDPMASTALQYAPTAIISVGLSSSLPSRLAMTQSNDSKPPNSTGPMFLWADVMGARPGDIQTFTIRRPDGQVIHSQQLEVNKGGLSWFAFSGKRPPTSGWPKGKYSGLYVIRRDGVFVAKKDKIDTVD